MQGSSYNANIAPFLFVYGTLMQDFHRGWQDKAGAKLIGQGTITAKLYDMGDYPGAKLVDTDSGYYVRGELYRVRDPKLATKILDKYEEFFPSAPAKSLFVRVLVPVTLGDGTTQNAWVYLYNRAVDETRLIPSGDYRDKALAQRSPLVTRH